MSFPDLRRWAQEAVSAHGVSVLLSPLHYCEPREILRDLLGQAPLRFFEASDLMRVVESSSSGASVMSLRVDEVSAAGPYTFVGGVEG